VIFLLNKASDERVGDGGFFRRKGGSPFLNSHQFRTMRPNAMIYFAEFQNVFYFQHTSCPGAVLHDYPGIEFCWMMSLGNRTVISQSGISPTLCSNEAKLHTRLKISKDYQDGEGESFRPVGYQSHSVSEPD
jgi:hypothetical protein